MNVYVYVCMMYVWMHACMYMYVCMYACMGVCMHVCMYVCFQASVLKLCRHSFRICAGTPVAMYPC